MAGRQYEPDPYIIDGYSCITNGEAPVGAEWRQRHPYSLHIRSRLAETGFILHVRYRNPETPPARYPVLGGYRCVETDQTMLLYRFPDGYCGVSTDMVCVINERLGHVVRESSRPELDVLGAADWGRFGRLRPTQKFRLGGRTWKKMTCKELAALLDGQVYLSTP